MGTVCDAVLVSVLQTPIFFFAPRRSCYRRILFFRGVAIVLCGRVGQISFRTDKFNVLHGGKIVYLCIHTFRILFFRRPTDGRSKRIAVRFSDEATVALKVILYYIIIIQNVRMYHGVTCLVFTVFFFLSTP